MNFERTRGEGNGRLRSSSVGSEIEIHRGCSFSLIEKGKSEHRVIFTLPSAALSRTGARTSAGYLRAMEIRWGKRRREREEVERNARGRGDIVIFLWSAALLRLLFIRLAVISRFFSYSSFYCARECAGTPPLIWP